VPPRRS